MLIYVKKTVFFSFTVRGGHFGSALAMQHRFFS